MVPIWWFPRIGVPPVITHFRLGFPLKNHPAMGVPHGNPHLVPILLPPWRPTNWSGPLKFRPHRTALECFCRSTEIVRFGKMWRTCRIRRHKARLLGFPWSSWMVMEHPNLKWMIEGYPHILGNLHIFLSWVSVSFLMVSIWSSTVGKFCHISHCPEPGSSAGRDHLQEEDEQVQGAAPPSRHPLVNIQKTMEHHHAIHG